MANTYKNIVITPNRDTDAANVPVIRFSGGDATLNTDINLRVYTTQSGTLSFEGSAGQLFSITNDLTNSIFSVNDVSGIPSLEIDANGLIKLAEYGGNVAIGRANANYKLDVNGTVNASAILINGNPALANTSDVSFNGNLYFPTGNISIGTNNSVSRITVYTGASGSAGGIRIQNGATGNSSIDGVEFGLSSGNDVRVWSFDVNNIIFGSQNSERMRIQPAGNVLIGRTDSTVGQNVKLDVNGGINASAVLVNGAAIESGISTGKAIAMAIVFG